ncbi:hypothetical protein JAAARDRAFT_194387 [Jaapia argillacea MUCL 33604]|uniref:DUF4604 domain-containing protein n=1 Tax=Jaapia argillacea MUCL 33604 TaxID=933084 RepID=A0A067PR38_9AGAM|nr:hypothetical protein JAAARDRAFT_194387 [Jaapia argillacea MUCL 33604]
MAPKDLTNAQLSSRLAYTAKTPAFLLKFQRRVAGEPESDEEEQDEEFEYVNDGSGRPPIPRRPPIPQRPKDQPGSAEEAERGDVDDDEKDEEAPQVVVLREGKHLSAWEAENEKRKAKGLPPLPDPSLPNPSLEASVSQGNDTLQPHQKPNKDDTGGLSFSSAKSLSKGSTKRKAIDDLRDGAKTSHKSAGKGTKKKPKKAQKKLLSFGDDES